jgi:hypothetical protein
MKKERCIPGLKKIMNELGFLLDRIGEYTIDEALNGFEEVGNRKVVKKPLESAKAQQKYSTCLLYRVSTC